MITPAFLSEGRTEHKRSDGRDFFSNCRISMVKVCIFINTGDIRGGTGLIICVHTDINGRILES